MSDTALETLAEGLTGVPLFAKLSLSDLLKIAGTAQRRHAGRDEFFFQQGDTADLLYVLERGQVRMTQLTPEGDQVILRYIRPRDMFGGIAALTIKTYPASAQALEECQALVWDANGMRDLMLLIPRLALNVLDHTGDTIVQLQDRVRELQTERIERRVARALLRLAQQAGKRMEAGVLIDLPLSRQDIAEMTGTNLYSVSRILSAWEKQGVVQTGRERVTISIPHKLVMIAEDLPFPPDGEKNAS